MCISGLWLGEQFIDYACNKSSLCSFAGIVCNFMENKSDSTLLQYVDETGTPFCVRINDMTTSRGIVQLRHRDTTVWESLHISEIRGRLEQILKII